METPGSHEEEDIWTSGFTLFCTSREELELFAAPIGEALITTDTITFRHYTFQPSVACQQTTFTAKDIINIDLKATPPASRIGYRLKDSTGLNNGLSGIFYNYFGGSDKQ